MRRAEAGEEVSRAEVKRIIQEAKANLNPKERRRAPSGPPVRRKPLDRDRKRSMMKISGLTGARVPKSARRWKNSVSA